MVWQATSQEAEKTGFTSARREMSERIAMTQTEQEFHRKMAVECFNKTWDFLKKKNRTPNDEQLMLNLAHSSRYHWSFDGMARGYAVAKEYRLAKESVNKARQQLRKVVLDDEDLKIYSDQIDETERMIKQ